VATVPGDSGVLSAEPPDGVTGAVVRSEDVGSGEGATTSVGELSSAASLVAELVAVRLRVLLVGEVDEVDEVDEERVGDDVLDDAELDVALRVVEVGDDVVLELDGSLDVEDDVLRVVSDVREDVRLREVALSLVGWVDAGVVTVVDGTWLAGPCPSPRLSATATAVPTARTRSSARPTARRPGRPDGLSSPGGT